MTKLLGITLRIADDSSQFTLRKAAGCVVHHFMRKGGTFVVSGGISYVNIYLHQEAPDIASERVGNFLNYHSQFDFERWGNISHEFDLKSHLLDTLLAALCSIADECAWDSKQFAEAACLMRQENLINQWLFKGKSVRSPNGKFYFGLLHEYDVASYRIWEVLYDKKRKEIFRRQVFADSYMSFVVESVRWNDSSDKVLYKFDGPKKVFSCKVADMLNLEEAAACESVTEFFRDGGLPE